jgi:hypothetical protein
MVMTRLSQWSLRKVAAVVVASAMTTTAAFAGSEAFTFETVAVTGEPAPGTREVFFAFNNGLFDGLEPAIDDQGRAAIFAFLPAFDSGIWSQGASDDGTLALVARNGDPAPGLPEGTIFTGFTNIEVPTPPQIGGGRTLFLAALSGFSLSEFSLWEHDGRSLIPLVIHGDPAPDLPGVMLSTPFATINGNGDAVIHIGLFGTGVSTSSNESLWTNRSGTLELIAREGDSAPQAPPGVVLGIGVLGASPATFNELEFNEAGQIAVQADLLGPGVDSFNDEALFIERDGALTLLVREGDPAPDGSGQGVTFGGNSVSFDLQNLSLNDLGHIAFSAELGGAISTTFASFSNHTGELVEVMRSGDPVPGVAGETVTTFSAPVLNDAGRMAIRASFETGGPPFGPPPRLGVYWDQNGEPGDLVPLILPDDPLTGADGRTLGTAGTILGYSADGRIAFSGSLDDPRTGPHAAIFLGEPDGSVRVIVATGDGFDVQAGDGDDIRIITDIDVSFLNSFSETGEIAFRLDFDDDSAGVFISTPAGDVLGDLDGDGVVGLSDLLILLSAWGACPPPPAECPADLSGDSSVGLADLLILLSAWG